MQSRDSPAHSRMERGVEVFAPPEQTVHQFLRPAPIARIERRRPAVERRVEEDSFTQVGEYVRRGSEAKERPLGEDVREAGRYYRDEAREVAGRVADAAKQAAEKAREAFRKARQK